MGNVDPTPEQLRALAARAPEEPVVMVNLLRFRADGGAESYARYGREVVPHLQRVGAKVIYGGSAPQFVIGEGERPWWDAILLVEYPTPAAFLAMVTSEEYREVHRHREEGLESAELIATSAWTLA